MSTILPAILGVAFILFGAVSLYSVIKAAVTCRESVIAEIGKVSESHIYLRGKAVTEYRPTYKYTYGGKEYSAKGDFSSRKKEKYEPGSLHTIRIDPKNPGAIRTKKEIAPVVYGIISLFYGVVMIMCVFM